jgi:hypothetical protein
MIKGLCILTMPFETVCLNAAHLSLFYQNDPNAPVTLTYLTYLPDYQVNKNV